MPGWRYVQSPTQTLDCGHTPDLDDGGQNHRWADLPRDQQSGEDTATGSSPKVICRVVKQACQACSLGNVAPYDLRRTCARLATSVSAGWSRSSSCSDM